MSGYNNSNNNSLSKYERLFTENIDINKCHDAREIISQYINMLYNNMTLLMYVCINSSRINQYIDIINYIILECNADINLSNNIGCTALSFAVRFSGTTSNEKTIKILINLEANVNVETAYGITPLMIASRYANSESTCDTIILLLKSGANVDATDKFGNTALMIATLNANKNSSIIAMDILIKYGANVNLKNNMKNSPLIIATKNCDTSSSVRAIKLLLDKNADIESTDGNGMTPLFIASKYSTSGSSIFALKMLINNGANINVKDVYGNTPLIYASKYSKHESCINAVKILLNSGAEINEKNKNGCTALMHTCMSFNITSSFDTVMLLLNEGADINITSNNRLRALCYFIRQQPTSMYLEAFLNKNPNLNYKDKTGCTPLILACIKKEYKIVKSLLFRSPNLTIKTNNNTDFFCFVYVDIEIKIIYEDYLKIILKYGLVNLLQDKDLCEKIFNMSIDYTDKTILNDINILKMCYFGIMVRKIEGECSICFQSKNILLSNII
jgi:ankyrin repeat protein